MADEFGDRMKVYEMAEAGRRLMPLLPVIARLDGKCFSGFTRGLARPYDKRLSDLMVETTQYLAAETNAACGYTQSDEITLAWYAPDPKSQIFFDGRIQKICSVLAGMCAVRFNSRIPTTIPEKSFIPALFDCRVWNVPNVDEGANVFLWRELDATKNSVSMAAREYYSHKALFGKGRSDMQEMLFQKGVNWNDYPAFFKRGTYVQRRTVTRAFTTDELEKLPPLHEARKNPALVIDRTEYQRLDMPKLSSVTNRPGVIFFGETPVVDKSAKITPVVETGD